MPIVVAVLGVIIVAMGAVLFFMPKEKAEPTPTPVVETVKKTEVMEFDEEVVANTNPNDPTYDGPSISTYTGNGTYLTPARTEHKLAVTLTLTGAIVTDAKVSYDGGDGFSNPNQENFDQAYKTEVVGKLLKDISLSRVGGASLTTNAFNQAVADIASQLPA